MNCQTHYENINKPISIIKTLKLNLQILLFNKLCRNCLLERLTVTKLVSLKHHDLNT